MRQAQAVENISEPERVRRALIANRDAVARSFPGRAELASGITHALAAREHMLTEGPPGTAKSAALRAFLAAFSGIPYFALQFNAQTDVQDIIGPLSIAALRDRDAREHNMTGFAPTAVVVYFDEVGKAAGACLNTTLEFMQEREVKGYKSPVHTIVGATNESVMDESGAFKDRWLFHVPVKDDCDDNTFYDMLRGQADEVRHVPPVALTEADLQTAFAAVKAIPIRDEILRSLIGIRSTLKQAGSGYSPRRWVKTLTALRAAAYLAGDGEVDNEHFSVLTWTLGTTDEERARVGGVLKGFSNGLYVRAVEIVDEAMSAWNARTPDYLRTPAKVHELHGKLKEAGRSLQRLLGDPRKPEARSKSQARAAEKVRPRVMELHGATKQLEKEAAEHTVDADLAGWK